MKSLRINHIPVVELEGPTADDDGVVDDDDGTTKTKTIFKDLFDRQSSASVHKTALGVWVYSIGTSLCIWRWLSFTIFRRWRQPFTACYYYLFYYRTRDANRIQQYSQPTTSISITTLYLIANRSRAMPTDLLYCGLLRLHSLRQSLLTPPNHTLITFSSFCSATAVIFIYAANKLYNIARFLGNQEFIATFSVTGTRPKRLQMRLQILLKRKF